MLAAMMMKTFEFLRSGWVVLADVPAFAENYTYSDPASLLIEPMGLSVGVVDTIYPCRLPLRGPRLLTVLAALKKRKAGPLCTTPLSAGQGAIAEFVMPSYRAPVYAGFVTSYDAFQRTS